MGRQWTDEEVAFIVKERDTRTFSEIGRILGRSYTSVKNKLQWLNRQTNPRDKTEQRWDGNDVLPLIKLRKLGKDEAIPQLPGLLDHLMSMSGSMATQIVIPNARHREYMSRIESVRPQIDDMLKQKISGYKIAQAIGVPQSTVYGYIKELRA